MTHNPPLVELEGVGKRYTKYDDVPTLIGRALRVRASRGPKGGRSQLWAVRHVDLHVERGQTLGILGRNGSGKSTLLSMMAGVTSPTEGVVRVRGRVAPLIAVGVGFHPELTGRENIYVNGTILGLTVAQINDRLEQIIDFAEIPEFIDTPVKFYSSGMFVRLGFAVAAAADPDLLLVDEILAVGDLAFQVKCYLRLRELQEQGTTIITVSHNLTVIRHLCSRVLVMDSGVPRFLGDTAEGVSLYHQMLSFPSEANNGASAEGDLEVSPLRTLTEGGEPSANFAVGETIVVEFDVRARHEMDGALGVSVSSDSGVLVYSDSTYADGSVCLPSEPGRCQIRFIAALASGSYTVQAMVQWGPLKRDNPYLMTPPAAFYVSGRTMVDGVADLNASFAVVSAPRQ